MTENLGHDAASVKVTEMLSNVELSRRFANAVFDAARLAGNGDVSAYLAKQAVENPTAFMLLMGQALSTLFDGKVEYHASDPIMNMINDLINANRVQAQAQWPVHGVGHS